MKVKGYWLHRIWRGENLGTRWVAGDAFRCRADAVVELERVRGLLGARETVEIRREFVRGESGK